MAKRITKKERADLAKLGRETAERACTDEADEATANDVLDFPECYVDRLYPYVVNPFADDGTEERFEIFKTAFLGWISDTYDESRIFPLTPPR